MFNHTLKYVLLLFKKRLAKTEESEHELITPVLYAFDTKPQFRCHFSCNIWLFQGFMIQPPADALRGCLIW